MTLTRRRPCAAPAPPTEPDMFGPIKQPRTVRHEPESVHADVIALRKDGAKVLRYGKREHMVDGRIISRTQLYLLAEDARRRAAEAAKAKTAVEREAALREVSARLDKAMTAKVTAEPTVPAADYVPFWRTQVERSRQ